MKYRVLFVLAIVALLCGTVSYAHHSFGATYNSKAEIKIEGKLVQFVFRNPHSFVHIETPDTAGAVQRWSVEWSGAAALGNQGLSQTTLKAGDHVIVTGRPSRTPGEFRVQMLTLKRPSDGFSWGTRGGEVVD
jgi:uncharacterized protein DUF6152